MTTHAITGSHMYSLRVGKWPPPPSLTALTGVLWNIQKLGMVPYPSLSQIYDIAITDMKCCGPHPINHQT